MKPTVKLDLSRQNWVQLVLELMAGVPLLTTVSESFSVAIFLSFFIHSFFFFYPLCFQPVFTGEAAV